MNKATLAAFAEELEMIKEAGFLRNVGQSLANVGKLAPGQTATVASNIRNTLAGFGSPVASAKKGLQWTFNDLKGAAGTSGASKWVNRAMLAGGLAIDAHSVMSKEDPAGLGRSRAERAVGSIGSQVGGLIGAPHGISGGIVGGLGGAAIGGAAGRVLFGHKRKKPQQEQPQQTEQPLSGSAPMPNPKASPA